MSNQLQQVRGAAGVAAPQPKTINQQLEMMIPEFAKVLGKTYDPQRLVRIASTLMRNEPKLSEDPQSLMSAMMIAATLRLEPGVMGQCYFIPYYSSKLKRNICTFIPGWQGHVDLVSRAGKAVVRTLAIREGDEFDYNMGSKPFVHFKPSIDGDEDRKLIGTIALGHIKGQDDFPQIEYWSFERIRKHLNRYNKVGERHYALSTGSNLHTSHNFEMYARKVSLLQVIKYVPKSIEWQIAANLDYAADRGGQVLTVEGTRDLLEGAELPPLDDAPNSPYAEAFNALDWTPQDQEKFLRQHAKDTPEQIRAALNAEIDSRNEGEL